MGAAQGKAAGNNLMKHVFNIHISQLFHNENGSVPTQHFKTRNSNCYFLVS